MSNTQSGPPGTGAADLGPRPNGAGSPESGARRRRPAAEAAAARRRRRAAPRPGRGSATRARRVPPVSAAPAERPVVGSGRSARARRGPSPRPPRANGRPPLDDGPRRRRRRRTGGPRARGAKRSRGRRRSGRDRKGKSVGRYLVCVHVRPHATQIAMLEGRTLVEHYVSRASDETTQIDGNIYWGRVQNVLPGMEAAFIDIGMPEERRALPRRRPLRQGRRRGGIRRARPPGSKTCCARARPSSARSRRTRSAPRAPG